MRSGFERKGLPRQLREAGADPDMLLLLDNLFYHGQVAADPPDARQGDLWIRKTATDYELRAKTDKGILTFVTLPIPP